MKLVDFKKSINKKGMGIKDKNCALSLQWIQAYEGWI